MRLWLAAWQTFYSRGERMEIQVKKAGIYEFVEEGSGPPLVLLHGLFGALSNWRAVVELFSTRYTVYIPLMPIVAKTNVKPTIVGLAEFIDGFLKFKGIERCTILGNSLGGHVGLVYALENLGKLDAIVLTGSSGLFESGMGSTFPRRGNYRYIKERVEYTFYSPETATKELIDEVFEMVNDNYMTLRILKIARDAQRQNLSDDLARVKVPTLLVWGLNDNITPPHVAHEFQRLLPQAELRFIDHCGHAAMMEQPEEFNIVLKRFLNRIYPQNQIA
jgi:pimeloyl-ACP methyl ester carboxylesterase